MTSTGGPLLLGIDMGSSRFKAILLDGEGTEVGAASVTAPFVTTGDRTEATAATLLVSLAALLAGLAEEDRRRVAAVGIAGMAESGAPFDGHGEPLAPVIAWHDRRGEQVATRLDDRFGTDLSRRIGQRIRYIATAAKLGWLVDDGLQGVATWLGVPELVLHALTGAEATEHSLAARTGCLDVTSAEWLPDVAEAAGFDVGVFPEILRAGAAMGLVTTTGAAWSGLPATIPVTLAGHDHLAGFVGSGAGRNDLANSVGTAETVVGRSDALPDVDAALARGAAVGLFPGGDGWSVMASAARAGLAVDSAAAALRARPAALDDLAGDAPADTTLLDAPGLLDSLRRRQPPRLPPGEPGAVWATLLDGLATLTGEAIEAVTHVTGPRDRLVVFGGGSTSRPWLQAKATHTTLAIRRSTSAQAVARGAALEAGVTAGWWPSAGGAPAVAIEPVTGRVTAGVKWGSAAPEW